MKVKSVLKSNHDLKKSGYQILRKLHKMERRDIANNTYATAIDDTYCFVLSVRALVEIISTEYPDELDFCNRCNSFLSYLDCIAAKKQRINCSVLASFLHAYTVFFNHIIEDCHPFVFSQTIISLWNQKCLMAYVAAWNRNI